MHEVALEVVEDYNSNLVKGGHNLWAKTIHKPRRKLWKYLKKQEIGMLELVFLKDLFIVIIMVDLFG